MSDPACATCGAPRPDHVGPREWCPTLSPERVFVAGPTYAELLELLVRIEKYAREDRAVTPRATRLERVLAEVREALGRKDPP